MTECIRHPESGQWTPVDELVVEQWSRVEALADTTAKSIAEQAQGLAVQSDRVDALVARLESQQVDIDVMGKRLTVLEKLPARIDALTADLAVLKAQVAILEIKAKTGPAFGPDMSGWQTVEQVAAAAADPDVDFIILKATEGEGGRNSLYPAQRAAAGAKFLGAYHFGWASQDPVKEAANFTGYANLGPEHIAFYDGEDWGETDSTKPNYTRDKAMRDATSWSTRVGFQLAWINIVSKSNAVMSYHNWSWIKGLRGGATLAQWDSLTSRPLWLAEPTGTPGQHSTVTAKDGSNEDDWQILLHQFATKPYDQNWTPDIAALRAAAVK